jgi:7-carboxy-7-deazaguanine synthase
VTGELVVNEVYFSLQGESTFAGLPCIFVRLTGCNLRCSYCDTAYAFREGSRRTMASVREEVHRLAAPFDGAAIPAGTGLSRLPVVEFTGGEPLLQENAPALLAKLCDDGFTVLVETNGARDIRRLDRRVRAIMDLKCPSSGESARNLPGNIEALKPTDEVKFVVATREDYAWMRKILDESGLAARCPVLVSWAAPLSPGQMDPSLKAVPTGQTPMTRTELADAIIADRLPVRFQLQAHKFIWPADARGV